MTEPDAFDRRLRDALGDLAGAGVPDYKNDVLARTSRMRQRPVWTFLERWLLMTTIARPAMTRRAQPFPLVSILIIALLTIIVAGAFVVGTRFLSSDAAIVPAPVTGPARNGLLAFDHPSGDIWVVDPDGSDPRPFVTGPTLDFDPAWSPDGTKLAYWALDPPSEPKDRYLGNDVVSAYTEGRASLVVVDADGMNPQVLVTDVRLDQHGLAPSWAPDGHALVYSHKVGDTNTVAMEIVPLDGTEPPYIPAEGLSPAWSPDGSSVAFAGRTEGRGDGIYIRLVDTREKTWKVSSAFGTLGTFDFVGPQWSPDSRRLTYHAPGKSWYDIYVAEIDGSSDVVVADTGGEPGAFTLDVWPAWSPDGTRIAFFTRESASYVVMRPDGSGRLRLKGERMGMSPPTMWSPDGEWVVGFTEGAFEVRATPGLLRLLDASGVREPVVTEAETGFMSSSWQRLAP